MKNKAGERPWILHALALSLIAATYMFAYRPMEDQRLDYTRRTEQNTARIRLADDAFAHRAQYIAAAENIRHELGNVVLDRTPEQRESLFLIDADQAAHRHTLELAGIEPQRSQQNGAGEGEEVLIHVRGRYGDIVGLCGDLVMMRALVKFEALDVERDDTTVAARQSPLLHATIRVVLVDPVPAADSAALLRLGGPA